MDSINRQRHVDLTEYFDTFFPNVLSLLITSYDYYYNDNDCSIIIPAEFNIDRIGFIESKQCDRNGGARTVRSVNYLNNYDLDSTQEHIKNKGKPLIFGFGDIKGKPLIFARPRCDLLEDVSESDEYQDEHQDEHQDEYQDEHQDDIKRNDSMNNVIPRCDLLNDQSESDEHHDEHRDGIKRKMFFIPKNKDSKDLFDMMQKIDDRMFKN